MWLVSPLRNTWWIRTEKPSLHQSGQLSLVKLNGIADQSIFNYNVRGPLGRTAVNRDIVNSIRDPKTHKLFPLFHNGITIIARTLELNADSILAKDYFVVNGCQSLTALFDNNDKLTDDLRILTKFIQMDPSSPEAEMVTRFSNNQNGVKARDFMANNPMQIRLQNEFKRLYPEQFWFEIKRGESSGSGEVISNEDAGLYLMAFDLKEPWATHRKYQVFEDRHADLFGRPEVTADRIVLCQVIIDAIKNAVLNLENTLFGKYVLTRFLLLYIVRMLLDSEGLADEIALRPLTFVRAKSDRARFRKCLDTIVAEVTIDLNAEVKEYGDDFDYRDSLRSSEWVKKLASRVVADHLKLVTRNRIPSFKAEWDASNGK
jgi:hypothetical protein